MNKQSWIKWAVVKDGMLLDVDNVKASALNTRDWFNDYVKTGNAEIRRVRVSEL